MTEELKNKLTEIQYHVTQENGTEPPFRNELTAIMKMGFMSILFQANRFSVQKINMMPVVDGQALRNRLNHWKL